MSVCNCVGIYFFIQTKNKTKKTNNKTMIIFVKIIISLAIILFGFSAYFDCRNDATFEFRKYLNHRGYNICREFLLSIDTHNTSDSEFEEKMRKYKEMVDIWDSINDISYKKMLFSFKPLEPKYWLTKEQINFLNL